MWWAGLLEVREPAASRVVQDPRRLHAPVSTLGRGEDGWRRRCQRGEPCARRVALAAQLLGISATVFMPEGATLAKVRATLGYGADVRFHGLTLGDSIEEAQPWAAETGRAFIHPYDHRDICAGQGTVGLEILEQCPSVRTVVVCTGGGGLLAGVATAIKGLAPDVRVVGVQAAGAAAYPPSLVAHHPVRLQQLSTMADGIAVPLPGDIPFAIVDALVDEVRTVSEGELVSGDSVDARAREDVGRTCGRGCGGGADGRAGGLRTTGRSDRVWRQHRPARVAARRPTRTCGCWPLLVVATCASRTPRGAWLTC